MLSRGLCDTAASVFPYDLNHWAVWFIPIPLPQKFCKLKYCNQLAIITCSTNYLGHGHGCECHSSILACALNYLFKRLALEGASLDTYLCMCVYLSLSLYTCVYIYIYIYIYIYTYTHIQIHLSIHIQAHACRCALRGRFPRPGAPLRGGGVADHESELSQQILGF